MNRSFEGARTRLNRLLRACRYGLAALLMAGAAPSTQAATFDVDLLLNWAERTYPQFFPGPQSTLTSPPYAYRCYPTGNCAGVADGVVYIYGPVAGGGLQAIGPMSQFECQVVPANCSVPQRSRIAGDHFVGIGRDATGRTVEWGQGLAGRPQEGEPIAGTAMRLLSTNADYVAVNPWGYMLLRNDGVVETWGHGATWVSNAKSFAERKTIDLPGRAVDVALNTGYFSAQVLLEDGSVWQLPGVSEVVNGQSRRRPVRIDLPLPIRALHRGSPLNAYYVARDGTVWRGPRYGETTAMRVAGVTGIDRVQCQNTVCVAQQETGGIWYWNINPVFSEVKALDIATPMPGVGPIQQVSSGGLGILLLGQDGLVSRMIIQSDWTFRREDVRGIDQVSDITCDSSEICFARRSDGTIWSWNGGSTPTLQPGIRIP